MQFYLALWCAKLLNFIISIINKEKGSNLSGEKALIIDPKMVSKFKNIDFTKVVFITGTNGKSTTTNLVNHILTANGKKVISNLEGANLLPGIATSLAKASDMWGNIDTEYIVFETDERYLPIIHEQLPAKNLVVTNLQKDQVQRNGDPDFVLQKIKQIITPDLNLYLNNEDPRSKMFETLSDFVHLYGVERHPEAFTKDESFPTQPCPLCHHEISFSFYNVDNIGPFSCNYCGYKSTDTKAQFVENANFKDETFSYKGVTFKMPYNLPYMLYNYSASLVLCEKLANLPADKMAEAFNGFQNIGGRFAILQYKNKCIKYMRIKQENPDTLQNTLNIIARDNTPKVVCIGLYAISDFVPFYTNTFYTFDCDFKSVINSNVEKYICFSPAVSYDTANRIIYEGVDKKSIVILENDSIDDILSEINNSITDNIYLITWLDTFNKLKKHVREEQN